jgi:hypothetical protein
MNETEIRERIHEALGEGAYPSDFGNRVEGHLQQPTRERQYPRALGILAAIIAVLLVAVLMLSRLQSAYVRQAGPTAGPTATASATPIPPALTRSQLPEADLAAASLFTTPDLVTSLKLSSTDGGHTVLLIGAYADPARTVLFFRTATDLGYPMVGVSDDQGPLNASSSSGAGIAGDQVFVLDAGPRPGVDGIAHLSVVVSHFVSPGSTINTTNGNWTFTLPLAVQPSSAVTLSPRPSAVGSWKLNIEALELTPSVIHLQLFIDGASVSETNSSTVVLMAASGKQVNPVAYSASVTVPKEQLDPTNSRKTRMNVQWPRAAGAQTYQLQITGGGAVSRSALSIEAPQPTPTPAKSMPPPRTTDYPAAEQSLNFQGALNAQVATAYPTSCGAGSGPNGELFSYAAYFQAQGAWYLVKYETDYLSRQYKGPGTYTVPAAIYPRAPGGPADPLYIGSVQLTVVGYRAGRWIGSVSGTLDWTGSTTEKAQVKISGGFTCSPGSMTGPG